MSFYRKLVSVIFALILLISGLSIVEKPGVAYAQSQSASTEVTVTKNGSALTLSSAFSDDLDISINCNTSSSYNGGFSWSSTSLKTGSLTNVIVNNSDDITPIMISGQYVGGNHGYKCIWSVPAAGHNKTAADKGSVWNIRGREFTLTKASSTTIYFLAPFNNTNGMISVVDGLLPTGTAVYVRGGSPGNHPDDITFSGYGTLNQLQPSTNKKSVRCFADDVEVTVNGTYDCRQFEIREQYDIMTYDGMVEYAENNSGVYVSNDIDGVVRMENVYTYTESLNCTVQSKITALKKFNCTLYGALQGMPISAPSYIERFMPNVKPKTAVNPNTQASTQFDFASGVNLTQFSAFFPSTSYALYYNLADFNDPAIPPSHTVDWACDASGERQYGFTLGLVADDISSSSNLDRLASCTSFWRMSATKKSYPSAIENTIFNPGDSKSYIGFRNYLCAEKMPDATMITSVKTNNACYLYIDYNNTISNKSVSIDDYIGRPVTVLQSENFELLTPVVGENGIVFNVTGNQGNAILKIELPEPILQAVSGSGCTVDYAKNKISGYDHQQQDIYDCFQVPEGYVLDFIPTDNGAGTGSMVRVLHNSEVVESYHILLYGDVNGDNNVDSADAGLVIDVENFLVQWDIQSASYLYQAADVNADGNVDSSDADILIDVENFQLFLDKQTGFITAA